MPKTHKPRPSHFKATESPLSLSSASELNENGDNGEPSNTNSSSSPSATAEPTATTTQEESNSNNNSRMDDSNNSDDAPSASQYFSHLKVPSFVSQLASKYSHSSSHSGDAAADANDSNGATTPSNSNIPSNISIKLLLSDYFHKKGDFGIANWKRRYFTLFCVEVKDGYNLMMKERRKKHPDETSNENSDASGKSLDSELPPYRFHYVHYFASSTLNSKTEKGTIYPLKSISPSTLKRKNSDYGLMIRVEGNSRVYYLSSAEERQVKKWEETLQGVVQDDLELAEKIQQSLHENSEESNLNQNEDTVPDETTDLGSTEIDQEHEDDVDSDTGAAEDELSSKNVQETTEENSYASESKSDTSQEQENDDNRSDDSNQSKQQNISEETQDSTDAPVDTKESLAVNFDDSDESSSDEDQNTPTTSESGTVSKPGERLRRASHIVISKKKSSRHPSPSPDTSPSSPKSVNNTPSQEEQPQSNSVQKTNDQENSSVDEPPKTTTDNSSADHSPNAEEQLGEHHSRNGSENSDSNSDNLLTTIAEDQNSTADNTEHDASLDSFSAYEDTETIIGIGGDQQTNTSTHGRSFSDDTNTDSDLLTDATMTDVSESHSKSNPNAPEAPDFAPVDLLPENKPLDIHMRFFSQSDISALLLHDRAARRMNHRLSRRKFISSVVYVDTLHLQQEKSVQSTMQNFGDTEIHYSGTVRVKTHSLDNKYLDRVLVITSQSLLIFQRREVSKLSAVESAPFGKVLNSFDLTKKRITYDFKERYELQAVHNVLISQSDEQRYLVSILLDSTECDIDLLIDFEQRGKSGQSASSGSGSSGGSPLSRPTSIVNQLSSRIQQSSLRTDSSAAEKSPSSTVQKDNFIRQITSAYRMITDNKKLSCTTVYNVLEYTRLVKGQSKPTPVSVEDDEIIRSTENDNYQVTDKLHWRSLFKQYGDNVVFYSAIAEKLLLKNTGSGVMSISLKQELERLIVVTNRALYNCSSNTDKPAVKRRVELEDISSIVVDSADDSSVLIVIPSEYDMVLKFPDRTQFIQTMEKVLITASFESKENVSRLAQLSKTAYIQKQKRFNDPERIRKNLQKGMKLLDKHLLKRFLERARQNDLNDDPVVVEAERICREIDQSEMLRKEWNRAWRETDLSYMDVLLKRARKVSIMQPFVRENMPKWHQVMNVKILTQKMRDAIIIDLNQLVKQDEEQDATEQQSNTEDIEESSLNILDMDHIQHLFDLCLRAGLTELVDEFRVRLESQVQKMSTLLYAKQYLQTRDRDGLLLTLENARRLLIDKMEIFDRVRAMIPQLTDHDKLQKQFEVHIEKALEYDDAEYLKKELKQFTIEKQSTDKSGPRLSDATIQKAEETISYLLERQQKKQDFSKLLNSADTPQEKLEEWIATCASDDYFDTLCLLAQKKIHSHTFELQRKKQIALIKDKFKAVLNNYKNTKVLNEEQLRSMIDSCRHFTELKLQIKAAETLLSNLAQKRAEELQKEQEKQSEQERVESLLKEDTLIKICFQEMDRLLAKDSSSGSSFSYRQVLFQDKFSRFSDIIQLRHEINDAIQSQNRTQLKKLIEEAQRIDQLQDFVEEAKEALELMKKQEEYSKALNQMLVDHTPAKQVEEFIAANKKNFTEELHLKARAVWETSCDFELRLNQCLQTLEHALKQQSQYAIQTAVKNSLPLMEYSPELQKRVQHAKALLNNDLGNRSDLGEQPLSPSNPPRTRKRNISDNAHINDLHNMVLKLLQQYGPDDINAKGKFPVSAKQPVARALLKKIYGILSHRLKKFVFRERTLWDVCKSIQMHEMQEAIRNFEAFVPPEKDLQLQSFYFIQFILDNDFFTPCMQELFSSHKHITKSYHNDAIIYQSHHREELNTVFLLLHQFEFNLIRHADTDEEEARQVAQEKENGTVSQSSDRVASREQANASQQEASPSLGQSLHQNSDPMSLFKRSIQLMVQFFLRLHQRNQPLVGDDRKYDKITSLVSNLSDCLMELLLSSRKKSIYQTHVWNIIKKIAKTKETGAVSDIGGVALPEAIITVEEILNTRAQYEKSSTPTKDAKFQALISHALNTRQLGALFESILRDDLLIKYYTGPHAYVLNPKTRELIIALLHKLDHFEFQLTV